VEETNTHVCADETLQPGSHATMQATIYTETKANQNKAIPWKTAVLGMEKPPVFPSQFSRGELSIFIFYALMKDNGAWWSKGTRQDQYS
jgi:hypothetical protein